MKSLRTLLLLAACSCAVLGVQACLTSDGNGGELNPQPLPPRDPGGDQNGGATGLGGSSSSSGGSSGSPTATPADAGADGDADAGGGSD